MNALFAVWMVVVLAILNVAQLSANILLQAQGTFPGTEWMNSAEHLTLSGALICAVVVLWKQLRKKDDMLIESAKTMTAALAGAAASNIELRRIIEESVAARRELSVSIDALRGSLHKLPCTDHQGQQPQANRHHENHDDDGLERIGDSRQDVGAEQPPHQSHHQKHYDSSRS